MENHAEEALMTTPTVPTAQFTALARRGQEATATAVRTATRALQGYAEAVKPRGSQPVDPTAATTATFDLAEQLLRVQRDYVLTAVRLFTEAGETATAHASAAGETLKARADAATARVVDLASETSRRTATAAHNGVSV
jgi:hypothetical protein